MSIIFQLFSADDLQKLTREELGRLSDAIKADLNASEHNLPIKNGKLQLNLEPKTEFDAQSPAALQRPITPKWAEEALLKRFYEISHQLRTSTLALSQTPFDFEELTEEHNSEAEELILKWGLTCELSYLESIFPLVVAGRAAKKFFNLDDNIEIKKRFLTPEQQALPIEDIKNAEIPFKDSDSVYSPFNPRHPGYAMWRSLV